MDQQIQPAPLATRRRRSLQIIYLLALISLLLGAYLFHHWFFMPEDLRRMQGNWVIVKVTDARGDVEQKPGHPEVVTFMGRTAVLPGMPDEFIPFDIKDGTFYLCDPDNTHTILGFKVSLPLWLSRAKGVAFGTYEFRDGRLVLCFIGEMDESRKAQEVLYLERIKAN